MDSESELDATCVRILRELSRYDVRTAGQLLHGVETVENRGSVHYHIDEHLQPAGLVEVAEGAVSSKGAAEDAHLFRLTDGGEEWLEEHDRVLDESDAERVVKELREMREVVEDFEDEVADVESELAERERRLDDVEDEVEDHGETVEDAYTYATDAQAVASGVEDDIEGLQDEVRDLGEMVDVLESRIEDLERDVEEAVGGERERRREQVGELERRLDRVEKWQMRIWRVVNRMASKMVRVDAPARWGEERWREIREWYEEEF